MQVNPYVFFNGNCEDALNFYHDALGAQTHMLMRYSDSPEPGNNPPGSDKLIMHARVQIGDSVVMFSDAVMGEPVKHDGFSLSIGSKDVAQAQRMFDALAAGGEVQMPFAKTFWSPGFGMLKDKFGIAWMVNVETQM